jgi:hypothetical protein
MYVWVVGWQSPSLAVSSNRYIIANFNGSVQASSRQCSSIVITTFKHRHDSVSHRSLPSSSPFFFSQKVLGLPVVAPAVQTVPAVCWVL